LWVRNHIYFRVFDEAWIRANLPDAEQQRQRAAKRQGFLQALGMSAVVVAVMAGLTLWAWQAQQRAVRSEQLAERQQNFSIKYEEIILEAVSTLENINNLTGGLNEDLVKLHHGLLDRIRQLDLDKKFYTYKGHGKYTDENSGEDSSRPQSDRTPQGKSQKFYFENKDDGLLYDKLVTMSSMLENTSAALQTYLYIMHKNVNNILNHAAATAPNTIVVQRSLSVGYEKLGDIQFRLGNVTAALQAYQQSLEIDKRLIVADPNNAEIQRYLSISYSKIAKIHLKSNELEESLAWYQKSLAFAEKLVVQDPLNQTLQNDLKYYQRKIADIEARLKEKEKK